VLWLLPVNESGIVLQFLLQSLKEALNYGVVPTISFAAHAELYAVFFQLGAE